MIKAGLRRESLETESTQQKYRSEEREQMSNAVTGLGDVGGHYHVELTGMRAEVLLTTNNMQVRDIQVLSKNWIILMKC